MAMPNPYLNYTVPHRAQRHCSKLYRTVSAEHNHSRPKIFLSIEFSHLPSEIARFAILGRSGLEQRVLANLRIEEQARKLFGVCRVGDVPIITFVNKGDPKGAQPFG